MVKAERLLITLMELNSLHENLTEGDYEPQLVGAVKLVLSAMATSIRMVADLSPGLLEAAQARIVRVDASEPELDMTPWPVPGMIAASPESADFVVDAYKAKAGTLQ